MVLALELDDERGVDKWTMLFLVVRVQTDIQDNHVAGDKYNIGLMVQPPIDRIARIKPKVPDCLDRHAATLHVQFVGKAQERGQQLLALGRVERERAWAVCDWYTGVMLAHIHQIGHQFLGNRLGGQTERRFA